MIYINIIYEDVLTEAVIIRLLQHFNGKFQVTDSYNGRGFGYLKKNISGFNNSSRFFPCMMITDLDNSKCPVELRNDWFNFDLHKNFLFCIAVREVESWLLADRERLASFLRISPALLTSKPDEEDDPKRTLINLAKKSRSRVIREDIVPINNNASIGPNYNDRLIAFVINHWNIEDACKLSPSLKRAFIKLQNFNQE